MHFRREGSEFGVDEEEKRERERGTYGNDRLRMANQWGTI